MNSKKIFNKKLLRSFTSGSKNIKIKTTSFIPLSILSGIVLGSSGIYYNYFSASEDAAHSPNYPFNHKGMDESFDSKSIRRGYQVFKNVCSACHGMNRMAMRQLVDVAYTAEEAKKIAAEMEIVDKEPDEQGKPKIRPGTLADYFPEPFKNEQEARFNNGGALPPDLSLVVKARDEGEDYVFALLTGYSDAPAGLELRPGLYYNAFFPGGAIGMAPPLSDGCLDYDDGTPATVSQMAKDVSTFLAYSSAKEQDERKKMGLKAMLGFSILAVLTYYHKRFRWSLLKSRRIEFKE
eukprot:gene4773-8359_t